MKFSSFNLKHEIVEALYKLGYINATPIQDVVIPKALKNESIIAQSETGTGKSHAFIIPILNNIEVNKKIQAIIIDPTRELAKQTYDFVNEFKKFIPDLSCKLFISGEDQKKDLESLKNGCEILVATPGRLNYLKKVFNSENNNVKTIVLDEADMFIDGNFMDDIDEIINKLDNPQIEVFSATISKNVEQFLKKYISPDYVITLSPKKATSTTVTHSLINTRHADIKVCVEKFIQLKKCYLLMIFANSQSETRDLYNFLSAKKYKCGILSGELQPRERKSMLRRIKNNKFEIIVCTDIASRGLDIEDVTDVLSIGIPNNIEYYFHRAGRCGRNFKTGNSYVFYDSDKVKKVQKLLGSGIDFKYLKFGDNCLLDDKPLTSSNKKQKRHVNDGLERDIKKAVIENKSSGVKPGYKRKVRLAVERVKRKHKREVIKKDIRRQMTERYKKQGRSNSK